MKFCKTENTNSDNVSCYLIRIYSRKESTVIKALTMHRWHFVQGGSWGITYSRAPIFGDSHRTRFPMLGFVCLRLEPTSTIYLFRAGGVGRWLAVLPSAGEGDRDGGIVFSPLVLLNGICLLSVALAVGLRFTGDPQQYTRCLSVKTIK